MSDQTPTGAVRDDSYVNRSDQSESVPVQADDKDIEDPIDAETADSDEQLGTS